MSKRNENRKGYQNTKAGWIPSDWDCLPLSKVAYVQTGIAKNGKIVAKNPIKVKYLSVANVQDGYLSLENIKEIIVDEMYIDRYSLKFCDVLFTEGGDFDKLGRGTIWNCEIEPCLHQNHVFAVRCKRDFLIPSFLSALAAGPYGRQYFQLCSKQSTNLASINSTQLKFFPVPIPLLIEQIKIVEIISVWDKSLRLLQRRLAEKRRLRMSLIQRLIVGEKRLSDNTRRWQTYSLGNLFHERNETNGTDLELLAITRDRGVIPASEIERKDSSNSDKTRYKVIRPGDIGYNTMRMWQGVSAVSSLEGIVSPAYTVCIPKEGVDAHFMGYLFKFPPMVHLFWRHSQGLVSDTLNLKFRHFAQIKVKIPEYNEQKRIATVLMAIDEEIQTLERQLAAFEKQKRGLMQKLLTGEIRVRIDREEPQLQQTA